MQTSTKYPIIVQQGMNKKDPTRFLCGKCKKVLDEIPLNAHKAYGKGLCDCGATLEGMRSL